MTEASLVGRVQLQRAADEIPTDAGKPFDLDAAIAHLYATTKIADPAAFADALIPQIPASDLREIAHRALREYIRNWFYKNRRFDHAPPSSAVAAFVRSPKLNAMQQILMERVHVGDGGDAWKMLGDCVESDLAFMTTERRLHAERNLESAGRLEWLRKALLKHKAKRVRDLPEKVILAFKEARE